MSNRTSAINQCVQELEEVLVEIDQLKEERVRKMKRGERFLLILNSAAILSNIISFLTMATSGFYENFWISGLGIGLCLLALTMYFFNIKQRKNLVKWFESERQRVERSIKNLNKGKI